LRGDTGSVWCLTFTHDGKTLAVGSHDGVVKFWNVATRREIMTLKAHKSIVCGLAFSDDRSLATIGVDQTMRLWTAPSTTLDAEVAGVVTVDPAHPLFGNLHYDIKFTGGTGQMANVRGRGDIDGFGLASTSIDNALRLSKASEDTARRKQSSP
jgi:WD40 repeat protein